MSQRVNIQYSVDNEIRKLLGKKFEVELTQENYEKIIIKIENYLANLEVENTIDRIINKIDESKIPADLNENIKHIFMNNRDLLKIFLRIL